MRDFSSLSEAMNALKAEGYTIDFNLAQDCVECKEPAIKLTPEEFEITAIYRFEGMSDPSDNSVLYCIEGKNGEKGLLADAYGVYADSLSDEMIQKMKINRN